MLNTRKGTTFSARWRYSRRKYKRLSPQFNFPCFSLLWLPTGVWCTLSIQIACWCNCTQGRECGWRWTILYLNVDLINWQAALWSNWGWALKIDFEVDIPISLSHTHCVLDSVPWTNMMHKAILGFFKYILWALYLLVHFSVSRFLANCSLRAVRLKNIKIC